MVLPVGESFLKLKSIILIYSVIDIDDKSALTHRFFLFSPFSDISRPLYRRDRE